MQVAMDILAQLHTSRTSATGVTGATTAQQVVCKRNGNGQLAVTLRATDEQSVRKLVLIDTATQPFDDIFLPYYILEEKRPSVYCFCYIVNTIECVQCVEMQTWHSVRHKFLTLLNTPFTSHLGHRCIVLAL